MLTLEKICVKRLSEYAIIPSRGSQYSAGYDLSSAGEQSAMYPPQCLQRTQSFLRGDVLLSKQIYQSLSQRILMLELHQGFKITRLEFLRNESVEVGSL
jgi:hypothetical protein